MNWLTYYSFYWSFDWLICRCCMLYSLPFSRMTWRKMTTPSTHPPGRQIPACPAKWPATAPPPPSKSVSPPQPPQPRIRPARSAAAAGPPDPALPSPMVRWRILTARQAVWIKTPAPPPHRSLPVPRQRPPACPGKWPPSSAPALTRPNPSLPSANHPHPFRPRQSHRVPRWFAMRTKMRRKTTVSPRRTGAAGTPGPMPWRGMKRKNAMKYRYKLLSSSLLSTFIETFDAHVYLLVFFFLEVIFVYFFFFVVEPGPAILYSGGMSMPHLLYVLPRMNTCVILLLVLF